MRDLQSEDEPASLYIKATPLVKESSLFPQGETILRIANRAIDHRFAAQILFGLQMLAEQLKGGKRRRERQTKVLRLATPCW